MAETIIRVPGQFKATEYGTPLANTSDLYDDAKNQSLNTTLQETDTALNGKQNTIADLSDIRLGAAAGATAYQKPAGGIPKTDFAQSVQTSLNLADTASQQADTYTKSQVDAAIDADVLIESNRAEAAEEQLRAYCEALSQSQPIPMTAEEWAAMTTYQEGVIYRVAGTTSYADWIYNGTTTIKMAEYDNAIDNEPTAESDNLVKSGGIAKRIFKGFFTGANDTYAKCFIDKLIPGNTYRLSMYNQFWDMTGVTLQDGNFVVFHIQSVAGGVNTDLIEIATKARRRKYYDFTVPAGSEKIQIGGRATDGVKVEFEVQDVTYLNELNNNIRNGIVQNYTEDARLNADTHEPEYYAGMCYTDFIPVNTSDTVLWRFGVNDNISSLFLYNNSKEYIGYYSANTSDGYRTITIPDNGTKYIKASFRSNIADPVRVNNVSWEKIEGLIGNDEIESRLNSLDILKNKMSTLITPANTNIGLLKTNMHVGSLQGDAKGTVGPEFRECLYSDYIKVPVPGLTAFTFTIGQKEINGELYNIKIRVQARDNNIEPTPSNSRGYLPYVGYGIPTSPVAVSREDYTYVRIGLVYKKVSDDSSYPEAIEVYEDNDIIYSMNQDLYDYVTDDIQEEVNALDSRVTDIENEGGKMNYNAIKQISRPVYRGNVKQADTLVLEWISDLHYDLTALQEYINIKSLNNGIVDILHSGDLISDFWSQVGKGDSYAIPQFLSVAGAQNILLNVGNHDAWETDYNDMSAHDDVYDRLMANQISNWGVVHSGKNLYWYKDYTDYGIRLISLDCMYWDATQKSWFENVLADAKNNDLKVVVCSHYVAGAMTLWNCSFTSIKDSPSEYLNSEASACVDAFQQAGGEFICWICGHMHRDYVGTLESYPDQIVIAMTTSNNDNYWQTVYCDSLRYENPFVKYAANLIGFDTYNKRITVLRLGDNYDQYLRHRESMCIDYGSEVKKLIYCS